MTEEIEATATEVPAEEATLAPRTFPLEVRMGGGTVTLYADGSTDVESPEKFVKELSRMRGNLTNEMLFAFVLVAIARLNSELDEISTDVD
jgi:hypothetical protein